MRVPKLRYQAALFTAGSLGLCFRRLQVLRLPTRPSDDAVLHVSASHAVRPCPSITISSPSPRPGSDRMSVKPSPSLVSL